MDSVHIVPHVHSTRQRRVAYSFAFCIGDVLLELGCTRNFQDAHLALICSVCRNYRPVTAAAAYKCTSS